MPRNLSIPTDIAPLGSLLDIEWQPSKNRNETLDPAASLMLGEGSGKIAKKLAMQAAKMSLMAQLRKLKKGGHLLVLSLGEHPSRPLLVRANAYSAGDGDISSPSDLKSALAARTPEGIKYLQHPSLGLGGKTIGVSTENNADSQHAYFAFISADHQTVTEFEVTRDLDQEFTANELEALSEVVKRSALVDGEPGSGQ